MKFRAGLQDLSLLSGKYTHTDTHLPHLNQPTFHTYTHTPSHPPTIGVALCFEKIGPSCLIYLSERTIKFASPKLASDEVRVFCEIQQVPTYLRVCVCVCIASPIPRPP